ncbi:uncharacterized protein LOC127002567 [Eriocheir sinensis]|uniref:uncharacterized protein LOC127002567 n=1 Tax=Eriocheir sinensis TaxID=95602 RepID=UPI0021C885C8|nr:uncharacterized protein LOC127002567 [Eriocheir sinensis]
MFVSWGQVRRLQADLRPGRVAAIAAARGRQDVSDQPFTRHELVQARKGRDTAAGADGITYSMLAQVGPAGDEAGPTRHSWREGRLPVAWKTADIQPIPKPREPTKPRPISLMSYTAKTAERMILTRLQWRLGPLHPHVFGFTRGVGTSDSIMALLSLVDNRPAVAVFLDLEKAFELGSAHAILAALVRKGIQGRLISWTEDYLQHRRARVRFQGLRSAHRELENGTPQGGILSPSLFNMLMDQLVSLPFREGTALLSYADDLVLVVIGPGNKVARAQQALDLVSEKCRELWLKVSAEKSRAMMFKAAPPDAQLFIRDVRLAWTPAYQYLGVWLDKGLSFIKQATYLKERTQARLNVMRAMTKTRAGATFPVLRLFYVQTVRALIDYSAPVLIALSPTQQRRIEVVQNKAMRTMLGAPGWASSSVMQSETRLVPLASRVQQIVACRVAKVLHQDRESVARAALCRVLPQRRDLFTGKTWLLKVAEAASPLPHLDHLRREGPDRPAATYVAPPPWQPPTAEIIIRELPASKARCTQGELLQHALMVVAQANAGSCAVYYTDGSVDPERGATGAAVVTGRETLSWRTLDHCSTLQTKLLVIKHALEHALQHRKGPVVLHTDSRSSLQVLQQWRPPADNVRLVTTILGLTHSIAAQGRHVKLNWVPSHVGLRGNEAADAAVSAATSMPAITSNVLPSLQQVKVQARRAAAGSAEDLHRQAERHSWQGAWYARATEHRPLHPRRELDRADQVTLHRLRLGYRTLQEMRNGFAGRRCEHCEAVAHRPLVHYLVY